jgi:Fe2+ transport system protein B
MLPKNSENIVITKMKHNAHLITKLMEHVLNILWKKIIALPFKLTVMLIVICLKMILMDSIKNKLLDKHSGVIVNVLQETLLKKDTLEENH